MNQDAARLGKVVCLVKTTKTDAVLEFSAFSYHHISAKARTSTSEIVAEFRLGIRVSLSAAVHAIAAQYTFPVLQVVDKEPFFAGWNGEIYKDVVVGAVATPLTIVAHLRQVLAVYLAIPLLLGDIVLVYRLRVLVVYRRKEWNASNYKQYDSNAYQ